MIFRKILLPTLIACLAIPTWYLGYLTDPSVPPWPFLDHGWSKDFYLQVLYPSRIQWGFGLVAITTILTVFGLFHESSKRKLIGTVIGLCMEEVFRGNVEEYRVTLYKKRMGWIAFYHHVVRCLVINWWQHLKKGLVAYYLKSLPNIGKFYLVCYSRAGHPHHSGSSTKFTIADSKQEVDGIASHVAFTEKPYQVTLPDISAVELTQYRDLSEVLDVQLREKISEHITKGHVKCFKRLKTMHRIPAYVWASPILGPDENIWGVLVMDCVTGQDPFTSIQAFEEKVTIYVRTIESILKQ